MKNIYAIFDRVSNEIVGLRMYALMCFRTHQEAVRYFADAINDKTSILNKHPADYTLIHCGYVDDEGNITPQKTDVIITGDTLVTIQQATGDTT